MKCEIYLYEKGRNKKWKLDIPENIQLNITYSFSDLTSPTTITDNYSKTITLPGTANNNKIFGYIYKFEREITNAYDIIGFNYNPSKRVSYDLVINDVLYQSGWVKLNKVTQHLGEIKYDITLYGDISNFLYKLSNGDIEDEDNKLLYSLSFPNNLSHIINKDTLKSFIDNSNSLSGWMTYIRANNGLYDEFESSKHLTTDASGNYVVTDILNGLEFDELQKRECRSYYQRPALSVRGIFDRIKNDENEFNLNLDESFFNDNNPYYSKSYLTLPLLSQYESSQDVYGTTTTNYTITANNEQKISYVNSADGVFSGSYINLSKVPGNKDIILEYEIGLYTQITDANYTATTTESRRFKPVPGVDGTFNTFGTFKTTSGDEFPIYDFTEPIYSQGEPTFNVVGNVGWCTWDLSNVYPLYKNSSNVRYFPVRNYLLYGSTTNEMNKATGQMYITVSVPTKLWCVELGQYFTATTTAYIRPITKAPSGNVNLNDYYPASYGFTGKDISIIGKQAIRSYYELNKDNLLDKETTQSKFLIDYCKLFGLIIDTDKKGNISLKTRNKFFEDYQILDWSNKLDYYQPIETVPLSFDTRSLTFKYNNSESKYENIHHNKYGIDYGELKINTGYEFNNESKSLFDSIFNNTVISKETDRFLIDGANVIERNSTLEIPAYFSRGEANREAIDTRFNLLFDNGLKSLTGNDVYWLSDDVSIYMLNEDIGGGDYCWLDCNKTENLGATTLMNYYRQYSTLYNEGNTVCSFDIKRPRENYASWSTFDYPENSTIYSQFWQNYINEIYNVNTKEISAYFNLSFNDMNSFSFKNFVVIGDTLFHPIKIENYNPLTNQTTKVTLVKVNNIDNYTSAQIVPNINVRYFTVTETFSSYCSLDMPRQVAEGGTFVCNIRKNDPLGSVYISDCELSMGGVTLNPADYIDTETETVTIPNVTGNIRIGISCSMVQGGGDNPDGPDMPDGPVIPSDPSTYTVTVEKSENCVLTYEPSVKQGDTFTCTVAIQGEGNLAIDKSSVTMGDTALSLADIYNADTGEITIPNVTGNIVLSIVCDVIVKYNVILEGVGCTLTGENQVVKGDAYSASSHQDEGTKISLNDCIITMGGVNLNPANYIINNAILIPDVNGDLYIKIVYKVVTYTVSVIKTNCNVDGPSTVNFGLDYNATIIPNYEYEVDYGSSSIFMGENEYSTKQLIVDNHITVPYVTDNLLITITCTDMYWNVNSENNTYCTVDGPDRVRKGASYTGTVIPDEGYKLKFDECLIMMGATQLNPEDYISNNTIYIPEVTGTLSIHLVCETIIKYYTVNWSTENCTITGEKSITEGKPFVGTITPKTEDWDIDFGKSTLTMGGVPLNLSAYVENNIITIPSVTGNVVIKVVCKNDYYYITKVGVECTITGADKVLKNNSYIASTHQNEGTVISLNDCVIRMGGATLNPADYITGNSIVIHNVTGDLYIKVVYVEKSYSVSINPSNCSVNGPNSVKHGLNYEGTIIPINSDYVVDYANTTIMKGNTSLNPEVCIYNNKITVPYVDANIVLNIVCASKYWEVDTIGSRCTIDGPSKVLKGNTYTATITPDSGYEIKYNECQIIMGRNVLDINECINGNTITIPNVDGNLSISIICTKIPVYYSVNWTTSGCTVTGDKSVLEGNSYTATITPLNSDYAIDYSKSSLKMNGSTLNIQSYISNNKLNISKVTGNIEMNLVYVNQYYYVDLNGTNCTVTGASKVLRGDEYTATIKVKSNYHLDISLCTITIGGTAVNASNYISGNKITIPSVFGDVYISIKCVIDSYTVSATGTRCTISGDKSVERGETYTGTITPNVNCTLDINMCHITMGQTQLNAADYISGNTITIPNVTDDLIIMIVCIPNKIIYNVNWTLSNCAFNGVDTAEEGTTYTANVIPNTDYEIDLKNTVIKMGNTTLSNSSVINGNKITIANVSGNITMNIVCVNTYWNVTKTATNCTVTGDSRVVRGNSYSASIIPDPSCSIDLNQCSITMGGTALTLSDVINDNEINIDSVTGDVVIKIVCVKNELATAVVKGVCMGALQTDTRYYTSAVTGNTTAPTILIQVPTKVEIIDNKTYISLPADITTRVLNLGAGCYIHIKYVYNNTTTLYYGQVLEEQYNKLKAGNNIDVFLLLNPNGGSGGLIPRE